MTIKCDHFVYAYGRGLIKSANVEQLLTKKSLRHLCSLDTNSVVQTWLPEGVIAVTFLQYGRDEYGRKTVWNHTILVSPQDYFSLNPPVKFEPYFIKKLDKHQLTLEPLTIDKV